VSVTVGAGGVNVLPATVLGVMYLGDHSEIRLQVMDDVRLLAVVPGAASVRIGDTITVSIAPDAFLIPGGPR
jgi:hypothetical protein